MKGKNIKTNPLYTKTLKVMTKTILHVEEEGWSMLGRDVGHRTRKYREGKSKQTDHQEAQGEPQMA